MSNRQTRRELLKRGLSGIAGLSLFGLSGCASTTIDTNTPNAILAQPSSGTLTMLFWGSATRDKLTQATFGIFEQENSGFRITSQYYGFNDYFKKLNALIASGKEPDLIQMDMRYIAQYVRKRQLLDMTELIYNQTINLSDYDPELLNSSKVNNTVYGIPFGGNYQSSFYDMDQVTRAGIGNPPANMTWDSFASYTAELTKALGGTVYGTTDSSADIASFELWMRQRGKDLYDYNGNVNFTATDAGDWYSYWDKVRKAGGCAPLNIQKGMDVTESPDNATLIKGKTAFLTTYSNLFETFQNATTHKLGIIMPPVGENGSLPGMYLKASMLLSISATTKYPLTAANYTNFVNNDIKAIKTLSIERGIPGSVKARTALNPLLTPVEQEISAYMIQVSKSGNARGKDVLDPPGAGAIADLLRQVSYDIAGGAVSVSVGGQNFYNQAKKIAQG